VKLLSEHADVRVRWNTRFRYLMVDEFQGYEWAAARAGEPAREAARAQVAGEKASSRPNVCVVGDDDQSIYGWRGAEVANILEFEAHFPEPVVVKLEQNYRSTNAILGTANGLIKNNPRRRPSSSGARARVARRCESCR
jgi:superfamily I DNA/RNA helicase